MKKVRMFPKRIAVFAVLIAALSAAVYLNWQYTVNDGSLSISAALSGTTQKYLGEAQYVNATAQQTTAAAEDFFATSIAERDSKRKKSIEQLQEVIDSVKSTEDAKNTAAKQLAELTQASEAETAVETLIKAKGFKNCVTVISDEQVSVIVSSGEEGLLESETMQIQDVVTSNTKKTLENIKIIEIK